MKRRMVALMLTGVMFAGMTLTVSAASTTPTETDVTTEGSVNYVDTTVYEVTLPTAGCFNFTVDPQGILSATDPTTYPEDKYPSGTAGYIVATEGTGAYINNSSSVPIKLTVEAYVVSDDTTGASSTARLMSMEEYGAGLINAGIDNNILLTMDVTADGIDAATFIDATSIKTESVNPYVIAITQNGQPDTTADPNAKGTQISFALNKAAYEFGGTAGAYTYTKKAGETGDPVGLRLSGFVNTNADWSAYTGATPEKIYVKTIFDFDKLSTDYELSALDGRAHGVLADTDPLYYAGMEYDADGNLTGNIAPGAMDYVIGQGALEIPFNFGTGTKEVSVTDVSVNGASIAATDYKVNNGVISLKSTEANVKAAMDAATPEGAPVPVAITTSDAGVTTVTVTMYAAQ